MTLDLSRNARKLIDDFPRRRGTRRVCRLAARRAIHHFCHPAAPSPSRLRGSEAIALPKANKTHSASQLRAVFGAEHRPLSRFAGTRRAYQRYLLHCGRLRPEPTTRFSEVRREYAQFIFDVRGLSVSSRRQHSDTVKDFLSRGLRPRQLLRFLTRADVERFVLLRSREVTRHSLQHVVAHVRAFWRFAHDRGLIPTRLDALDTPRTYRDELPPRAVPWPMVQQLLASIDLTSKSGPRDHCILHLIAHYGLRPSEVVPLRLDCIDWQKKLLRVEQIKTRSVLILPLAAPTLKVLKSYLRERARQPSEHAFLFRRARCPYIPLERTARGCRYLG